MVAVGLGVALGVVTGMPLGVVNVAVVEAAAAGEMRFATAVGVGGALADAVHATLAFVGLGGLVVAEPAWTRGLAIAAAVLVVGYAVATWRRRDSAAAGELRQARPPYRGVVAGFTLTLPNPGALAAWVAVAAAVWPDIALVDAVVLGVSVGVGSALWFAVLARVVARKRDTRLVRVAARAAVVTLVALAAFGAVRAVAF